MEEAVDRIKDPAYNTFVLRYSVGDACTYPKILEEVSLAIWQVRSH